MTNYERIAAEIKKELELQQKYKNKADESARRVIELRKRLVDSYPKFIDNSVKESPNKFIYKERFPTSEEIRAFYQYGENSKVSIYEYGWFDIKELAVLIKVLYSLKKQKEYKIITLADFKIEHTGPETVDRELVSYINFLIGLDKKIDCLEECNGKYFKETAEDSLKCFEREILKGFNSERHQDLVRLKQCCQKNDSSLEIKLAEFDKNWLLYYEPMYSMSSFTTFSSKYNIFDKCNGGIIRRLDNEPRKNIGSLLSFSLDLQDNFIAKILMCIVIYKKKINKLTLDNDDYKYILYELFKENIDISKIVDREIPKILTRYK